MMDYIKIKKENDSLFEIGTFDGQTSEYFPDQEIKGSPREDKYTVSDNIVKQTTIGCLIANREVYAAALNFANPVFCGGAYVMGGNAQEESLCRASGLYYTIRDVRKYYDDNRPHYVTGATDNLIYSENVPIIRDDSGRMLDEPFKASFITSAAVNRYASPMSHRRTNEIMERRIRKLISFAAQHDPELLILGAYGCGAFGNRRDEVLPMFERAINDLTGGCRMKIVFAIP